MLNVHLASYIFLFVLNASIHFYEKMSGLSQFNLPLNPIHTIAG